MSSSKPPEEPFAGLMRLEGALQGLAGIVRRVKLLGAARLPAGEGEEAIPELPFRAWRSAKILP
ncbi:MAG: hypothetical protein QXV89_05290 [Candidatus Bathyarchaeia archaeon]